MVSLVSTVRDIDRLRQILIVLGRHGFGEVVQRTGLLRFIRRPGETHDLPDGLDEAETAPSVGHIGVGERVKLVLQDLGPSFVKLGQILSTRPDVVPEDIIEALKDLQDRVAPVPFEDLKVEVEAELGATLSQIFETFEEAPLASASIAQVHRATLLTADGVADVVVKIQRPRIRTVIERDIELLYILAKAIERSIPEARIYSPVGLVSEFDRAMTAELDFTREADHAERFLQAFAHDETARFPVIYKEASGKRVLTMERLDGKKLSDALREGYRGERLAKVTLQILFTQIFKDGFFHGDPHPGNLMIMGTPEAPVLGMIDLGLVGRLSPALRDKTVDLMLAAARKDSQGVADALYAIGNPTKKIDRSKYEAEVTFLAERYLGKPLKEIEVSLLIRDIISGAIKFGLEIPPEFLMLGRTLMTVEGVGKQMYEDLDVFSEIQPFFIELVKDRYSPERISNNVIRTLTKFGERAGHMPDKLDEILDDLRRGELTLMARDPELPRATDLLGRRIFSGLTVAALIGGGSLLVASGTGAVAGYVMLGGAGVWLLGHGLRAARAYRKMTRPA
ncbi:MAG: hypothetical protein H6730_12400 [Deltaproteobacteria bacterium]|nr:hypothetical protein [Deltaproteobacteria bacterium]